MSCMSQNFSLFHVSNLSVRNFRIFLLMYTGSDRSADCPRLRLRELSPPSPTPLRRLRMHTQSLAPVTGVNLYAFGSDVVPPMMSDFKIMAMVLNGKNRVRVHIQDYFTIKVCSVGKSDRRRDVTQGNPLRPSEWGFKIGYFPNNYGNFCTFSCFSLDTEDQIFQWSNSYRCAMYTYGARPL